MHPLPLQLHPCTVGSFLTPPSTTFDPCAVDAQSARPLDPNHTPRQSVPQTEPLDMKIITKYLLLPPLPHPCTTYAAGTAPQHNPLPLVMHIQDKP
jgi:hypothetical protein